MARTHDVFLSHNSVDKPLVEEFARRLKKEGVEPWLDKWHLIPGVPWQPAIEEALNCSKTIGVFIGREGVGPWQHEELRAAIDRRVSDPAGGVRVIPVLLPGAERPERSKLPTFLVATTWVEFRHGPDDPEAFHRLLCGIRGVPPEQGFVPGERQGECPYRGLRCFDVGDAGIFFGREALTEWLVNDLRTSARTPEANRFLSIVGASGSGKSSVARAGLVASLSQDVLPGSSAWIVAVCRPGRDPLENLAVAVTAAISRDRSARAANALMDELKARDNALHLTSRLALEGAPPERRLFVLIDQFEEVFTLCTDEQERRRFIGNILHASTIPQGPTIVVLTMRADFYGNCARYADLAGAMSDHHLLVTPMSDNELRQAIEQPARIAGAEFEPGLVDRLIEDTRRQPGALPLLQHALLELWSKSPNRRMTFEAYREIRGLEGAVERRADEIWEGLDQKEREICRRLFLRLTQIGGQSEGTRRRATLREVLSASDDRSLAQNIVQKLAEARLITVEGQVGDVNAFIEVAHEALIRSWPRLRAWIDADRAGLRTHHELMEASRRWTTNRRDRSYLFAGTRLVVGTDWTRKHIDLLSEDERDFLLFSIVESGGVADWLPKYRSLAAAIDLMAPYLESSEPRERERGVSVLGWIVAPDADEDLRDHLFSIVVSDPVESVRFRAAEVLSNRGFATWLASHLALGGAKDPAYRRVLNAVAHCRNTEGIGGRILGELPRPPRRAVTRTAAYHLLRDSRATFAIFFSLTFMTSMLAGEVVRGAFEAALAVVRDDRTYFVSSVGPLCLAAFAVASVFLMARGQIDGEAVATKKTLAFCLFAYGVTGGALEFVRVALAASRLFLHRGEDLGRVLNDLGQLLAGLVPALLVMLYWRKPSASTRRDAFFAFITAATGSAISNTAHSVANINAGTPLPYRIALGTIVGTSAVFFACRGFRSSFAVAGLRVLASVPPEHPRSDPRLPTGPFGDFETYTPSTSPRSLREHTRVDEGESGRAAEERIARHRE